MYSAGKAMHSSLIYDALQIPPRDQFYVVEYHDQATNQASKLSYYYAILLKESYVECHIEYKFDTFQITNLLVYCCHL